MSRDRRHHHHVREFSAVILGAGGVGKSALALRFMKGYFHETVCFRFPSSTSTRVSIRALPPSRWLPSVIRVEAVHRCPLSLSSFPHFSRPHFA